MGFRNPITTAIDPVARASADAAGNDAARALTQIIPGSRLAADAIDGKTITGVTVSGATVIGSLIRASGSGDATPTSTGHALQTGPSNGRNVAIDGNEILARNNGALAVLFLTSPHASSDNEDLTTASSTAYATKGYTDGQVAAADVRGKVQQGSATITPSAANTPTSVAVTFPKAFTTLPCVVVTPNSSVPGSQVTGVGASNVTKTGFTLWLTRTTVVATGLYWIAADGAL